MILLLLETMLETSNNNTSTGSHSPPPNIIIMHEYEMARRNRFWGWGGVSFPPDALVVTCDSASFNA